MDGTTLFDLKRLRKDLKDLVDFDAGESNVPVLAAIYEIIEKHYVNKSTNYLYQLASAGNIYGEKLHKKGTVTYRELCEQKKETLTYLVFNFLQNITGRLVTKDMFQKYSACDTVDQFSQLFNRLPPANAAILGSLVIHLARIVNISENLTALKMSRKFDILVDSHVRHAVEGFIQKLIELELKTPGVMMYLMIPKTNPQNTGEERETYDNVGDGNNHHDQQESQSHIRINQSTVPPSGTSPERHPRGGTSQGSYPGGGTSQGRQPEVHGMGTRSQSCAMRGQTSSLDTNTDYGARTGNFGIRTPYDRSKHTTETTDIGNNEETMPQVHHSQHEVNTGAFQLREEDRRVLEDENKELKNQIESWTRSCGQLRTKYNKLKESHKELEKDKHQLVTDLESAKANVFTLCQNLKESNESNDKKRREVSRLENEMAGLEGETSDKQTELAKLKRESSGKQKKIDELERKVQGVMKIQDDLREENTKLQDDLSSQKKKLDDEIGHLKYSLKLETNSVNEQKDTISTLERAIDDLKFEKHEISRQLQDKSTECRHSNKENEQLQTKNETLEAKVAQTQKKMREKLEEHKSNTREMIQKHSEEMESLHTAKNQEKIEAIQNERTSIAKLVLEGVQSMALEIETGKKSTKESSVISSQSPSTSEQGQVTILREQLREKEDDFDKQTQVVKTLRKAIENMKAKSGQSNAASDMGTKKYQCKHSCSFDTNDGYELQHHMLSCTGRSRQH